MAHNGFVVKHVSWHLYFKAPQAYANTVQSIPLCDSHIHFSTEEKATIYQACDMLHPHNLFTVQFIIIFCDPLVVFLGSEFWMLHQKLKLEQVKSDFLYYIYIYIYIYIWRVQMQKPLNAIWKFLIKWAFLSGSYAAW